MFDYWKLLLILLTTFVIFGWIFKNNNTKLKAFFLFFVGMYLVYAGVGGALEGVIDNYTVFYIIFSIFVSLGLLITLSKSKKFKYRQDWSNFFDYFLERYSKGIIITYYVIILLGLVVPEFKLMNIINPPSPNVLAVLRERYHTGGEANIIVGLLDTSKQLLYPFFLFSLYKYREKIITLSLIVIGTYYIQYCQNAYLSRGSMMEAFLIIFAFTYFFIPKLGKTILITLIILIPTIMVFFVQYSITRLGANAGNISSAEAFEILIEQEAGFPLLFSRIQNMHSNVSLNYLIWLFTMPLPGFFRFGMDANFNAIFSEMLMGIGRGARGFYIVLPGIVGESVFLLGKDWFWLNGLIFGLIMGYTCKLLSKYPQLFGILIAAAFDLGYVANRAGLVSSIPFILKNVLYFYLIMWFIKNHIKRFKKVIAIKQFNK